MIAPVEADDILFEPWRRDWRPWPADPSPPCWTCGANPVGTFPDGSPRYDCHRREPDRHPA